MADEIQPSEPAPAGQSVTDRIGDWAWSRWGTGLLRAAQFVTVLAVALLIANMVNLGVVVSQNPKLQARPDLIVQDALVLAAQVVLFAGLFIALSRLLTLRRG